MKPRRILSVLLLSLGLILLTFAATCRLVMTNIQIDYDPSSPMLSPSPIPFTFPPLSAFSIPARPLLTPAVQPACTWLMNPSRWMTSATFPTPQ